MHTACFKFFFKSSGFSKFLTFTHADIFANSFDSDQGRANITPDLDPNCLTLWGYLLKEILKKLILEKKSAGNKKA